MGRNLEKDAIEMASKNQRILENGLRIFAENSIESITMNDVAKAAGIAVSSLYRYYHTKPELVMAICTWAWDEYAKENARREALTARPDRTAADMFEFYLDSFLDLYLHHKNLLCFNQFFNTYLRSETIPPERMQPYLQVIHSLEERFGLICRKAREDGTLRLDLPEKRIFSATLHLMLAVVTRYAVGLVFEEAEAMEELRMQKEMLMRRFVSA